MSPPARKLPPTPAPNHYREIQGRNLRADGLFRRPAVVHSSTTKSPSRSAIALPRPNRARSCLPLCRDVGKPVGGGQSFWTGNHSVMS